MAWTLTAGGVAVQTYLQPLRSLQVTNKGQSGSVATLKARFIDVDPYTLVLATEQEVILTDPLGGRGFAGYLREMNKSDYNTAGRRRWNIVCQDFNTDLVDDIIPLGTIRSTAETDKARVQWLITTFTTRGLTAPNLTVKQVLGGNMPAAQDFSGLSLYQALQLIRAESGAEFYVDYFKQVCYEPGDNTRAGVLPRAPFDIDMQAPNPSAVPRPLRPAKDFEYPEDTVDFINEVLVIGAVGISATVYRGGSAPPAGTRRAVVHRDENILTVPHAQQRGAAVLGGSTARNEGSFVTWYAGLRAGQVIHIKNTMYGIDADFPIAQVDFVPVDAGEAFYRVDFGSTPLSLGAYLGHQASEVAALGRAAAEPINLIGYDVGGGNSVPNGSFEDATGWTVGAGWTVPHTVAGGQTAIQGTDVARLVRAANQAGDLVTPFIPITRTADYWVSAWRFIRSITAGTVRMTVREYDGAATLVASTHFDATVADTDWLRITQHFGNFASFGVQAWHGSTTQIKIAFNSASANATTTADWDGVQVERGMLLTAFAPTPYELIDGQIVSADIADEAITTVKLAALAVDANKIAANAIVAGKIAAGIITALELGAGAVTAEKIAAGVVHVGHTTGNPGNSCPNPSFEYLGDGVINTDGSDVPGWLVNADHQVTDGTVHNAGNALRLRHTGVNADTLGTAFPVAAERRYRLSFWHRGLAGNAGTAQISVAIRQLDGTGAIILTTFRTVLPGTSVVWVEDTFVLALEANATAVRLDIRGAGTSGDFSYIDDMDFHQTDLEGDYAGGNVRIDAFGITMIDPYGSTVLRAAGFEGTWRSFINRGIYNADFAVGSGSDIPVSEVGGADTQAEYDESLSDGLPYWVVQASANTLKVVADATASSGQALDGSGAGNSVVYQDVPIMPGRAYAIIARARTAAGSGTVNVDQVRTTWRNATHGYISDADLSSGITGEWDSLQFTSVFKTFRRWLGAAPSAAAYLRVALIIGNGGRVSDVALETVAPALVTGTLEATGAHLSLTTSYQSLSNLVFLYEAEFDCTIRVWAAITVDVVTTGGGIAQIDPFISVNGAAFVAVAQRNSLYVDALGRVTIPVLYQTNLGAGATLSVDIRAMKTVNAGSARILMESGGAVWSRLMYEIVPRNRHEP